jgi:hypothetical protein
MMRETADISEVDVAEVKWRRGTSSHAEQSEYTLLSSEDWEAFTSPELASVGTAIPFSHIHQCSFKRPDHTSMCRSRREG